MWVSTCIGLFVNVLALNEPTSFPPWSGKPFWREAVVMSYKLLQDKSK